MSNILTGKSNLFTVDIVNYNFTTFFPASGSNVKVRRRSNGLNNAFVSDKADYPRALVVILLPHPNPSTDDVLRTAVEPRTTLNVFALKTKRCALTVTNPVGPHGTACGWLQTVALTGRGHGAQPELFKINKQFVHY